MTYLGESYGLAGPNLKLGPTRPSVSDANLELTSNFYAKIDKAECTTLLIVVLGIAGGEPS